MAGDKFNVGSDTKITILVNGAPLFALNLTSFEAKQDTTQVKSTNISGSTTARELPMGWNLDLEFDRGNPAIDNFIASEEANRFAGIAPADVTILEKTINPDNSISRFRYEGVSMKLDSAGDRKGDAKVTQKVSAYAARRKAA